MTNLPTTIIKTGDENCSNNTFQDDDHLSFSVEANQSYEWTMDLMVITTNTADFKYQLTGPAASNQIYYYAQANNSNIEYTLMSTAFSTSLTNTFAHPDLNIKIRGFLNNGANAGTVMLQWAQNTTSGTTTIKQGSALSWRKIYVASGEQKLITQPPASSYNYTVVVKTIDESVSNANTGATFQSDNELFFPVVASGEYQWSAEVNVDLHATPDIKVRWDGPSTPTFVRSYVYSHTSASTSILADATSLVDQAFGTSVPLLTNANNATLTMEGYVRNGANAGNVTLQWAQNTSDANNVTVLKGSRLKWRKIN